MKKEENYFLEKKHFYVSDLHMGLDGLESISDYKGPYKTLKGAQKAFKDYVCADKFLNHWDFGIRGPEYSRPSILNGMKKAMISAYKTIWYNDGTLKKY